MANEKRIAKEIQTLVNNKEPGFSVYYDHDCIFDSKSGIYVKFKVGSGLYEGQVHVLRFDLKYKRESEERNFPFQPPGARFITHILHANIGTEGGICLDTLNSNWIPVMSILSVYQTILALLDHPENSSPLNYEGVFKKSNDAHSKVTEYYQKNIADINIQAIINHKCWTD
jgi:ubiquitin-protein ligase